MIATPCAALSGMDHYKAAYEAAFKFQGACSELEAELGRDVFDASQIPTVRPLSSMGDVQRLVPLCKTQCSTCSRPTSGCSHPHDPSLRVLRHIGISSEMRTLAVLVADLFSPKNGRRWELRTLSDARFRSS